MSNTRIWKYPMVSRDCTIEMPRYAKMLSCQMQGQFPCFWCMVDTTQGQLVPRRFIAIGTGYEIPQDVELAYIATVQSDTGLVHHIFEVLGEVPAAMGKELCGSTGS